MKIISSINLISILVSSSLYVSIWSYIPGKELQVQLISLSFIVAAGFCSFLVLKKFNNFTIIEVLFLSATLLSLGTSFGIGNIYSIQYSLVFGLFCLSLVFIVRILSIETIVKVFCNTIILIIISIFLIEHDNLALALSVVTTNHGLFRFTPLGMHPNLTGMVYAGSSILLIFRATYTEKNLLKLAYFLGAVMCIAFILASSARASLLGLTLIFIMWLYKYLTNLKKINISYIIIYILVFSLIIYSIFDKIFLFLSGILEFESSTRGISSGGTGRFELWALGAQGLLEDPTLLFFGYGLRSSGEGIIGFSLESSYLTLLYEFGLIITICILIRFYYISLFYLKKRKNNLINYSLALSILYLIFQSIFNRYLIAIGNFYSIIFIIIIFKGELMNNNKKYNSLK